jgi:hypothetical protein
VSFWKQVLTTIMRLFGRRPAQLPAGPEGPASIDEGAAELPEDMQAGLRKLAGHQGVVVDTVAHALRDYAHLREVMMGPGASVDAVDDVTMIAEAQSLLRAMISRAPDVKTLLDIAGKRENDREGRASAGNAALVLRDQGRSLHEVSSAALQWASSRSEADMQKLQERARGMTASIARE